MKIFPSLISSDLLNLNATIKNMNALCAGYHIDVMDDHFVPNLTWGAAFVNAIAVATALPLHVHLMVDNPVSWVKRINLRAQDTFIFHVESVNGADQVHGLIQDVKSVGCKVGIAVNPKTDISVVFDFLPALDHVLIMSVQPGFSGQKYMNEVENKIAPLVSKKGELGANFEIGMDGGIGAENIKKLSGMGVDCFGVASAIFSSDNPIKTLQELSR